MEFNWPLAWSYVVLLLFVGVCIELSKKPPKH